MKSKKVIQILQELDPTGEEEVCVENIDIHYITKEPAYYDGHLQVLERDEKDDDFNIKSAKYVSQGAKLVIETQSIEDMIHLRPNSEVTFDHEPNDWELKRLANYRQDAEAYEKWSQEKTICGQELIVNENTIKCYMPKNHSDGMKHTGVLRIDGKTFHIDWREIKNE
jgi:hypothetical protein